MSEGGRAFAGIRWTGSATAVTTVLQVAQMGVMMWFIDAEVLGLYYMVGFLVGLAQTFADMGMGAAVIQRAEVTAQERSTLYWFGVAGGAVLAGLCFLGAPLFAAFYGEPSLISLARLVSLLFLIPPLALPFQWMLQRELSFQLLSRIDMFAAFIAFLVGAATAIGGAGAFSPLGGQIAGVIARAVALWAFADKKWRPLLHFDRKELAGFLRFGMYQLGERGINYFNTQADQIVIGATLGKGVLGHYGNAANLITQPISRITATINGVAFPVLVRAQSDIPLLRSRFFEVLGMLMLVTSPALVGIVVVAYPLSSLRESSADIAPFLQVLAIMAILRGMINPVGALLLARARVELGFRWNLGLAVIHPLAMTAACVYGGINGLTTALVVLQCGYTLAAYPILVRPLIGECLPQYALAVGRPVFFASLMGLSVWAFDRNIQISWPMAELSTDILVGVVVYAVLALVFMKRETGNLRAALRGTPA